MPILLSNPRANQAMGPVKRIVCLANSKKMSGRCIAGREIREGSAGPWIRPVSNRQNEEVSENERQYKDGSDPRLLDVIEVPLLQPIPHACQTENWLLDPNRYWRRIGRANWNELQAYVEDPPMLWVTGSSTFHGAHDEIPLAEADRLPRSLYLIRVAGVDLHVFAPQEAFGNPKRRVQVRFRHGGVMYRLWNTDPQIEREYLTREDGNYALGECCLTISLGEPYEKKGDYYRYKLVAAILPRAGGSGT
jgi:hypothetical protein